MLVVRPQMLVTGFGGSRAISSALGVGGSEVVVTAGVPACRKNSAGCCGRFRAFGVDGCGRKMDGGGG